MNKKNTIWYR